jgi:hypothetical protein
VDDLDHEIDQPIRELALPMREEQRINVAAHNRNVANAQ